jgi:hypothetical protein
MKFDELFPNTFKALRPHPSSIKHQVDLMLPSMPMVEACRADDFDFFHPFIASGHLSPEQMHHACDRYHLGKTRSGRPIFWMIDDMRQPLDAHIGTTTWLSSLLKIREHFLEPWQVQHCLFGLHLLSLTDEDDSLCHTDLSDLTDICCNCSFFAKQNQSVRSASSVFDSNNFAEQKQSVRSVRSVCDYKNISVVESEASAVVLSELFPESIWMAYATTPHLTPDLFAPLEGRSVTIYPRTDPSMNTYLFFLYYADLIRKNCPSIDLTVDTTLEDHASDSQKDRCIDLLEFLLDSL